MKNFLYILLLLQSTIVVFANKTTTFCIKDGELSLEYSSNDKCPCSEVPPSCEEVCSEDTSINHSHSCNDISFLSELSNQSTNIQFPKYFLQDPFNYSLFITQQCPLLSKQKLYFQKNSEQIPIQLSLIRSVKLII